MELYIAGGVGEHGRSCFAVQSNRLRFLVDCGKQADTPDDPYPRLSVAQIRALDAVFFTHSHADHTGALPWLYENGFSGTVIASTETMRQLPFPVRNFRALESLCPAGSGSFGSLSILLGRSGHCAGSVWYRFAEGGASILFSGDYTENTQVYACDPIRGQSADLAVLDCAYAGDTTPYAVACDRLVNAARAMLSAHGLILLPVPKYGRGLELLKLLSDHLDAPFYGDAQILKGIAAQRNGGFWYRTRENAPSVQIYDGQTEGIVFLSDPQLRSEAARETARRVLSIGGRGILTGTLEAGSESEALHRQGSMLSLRYPVHMNTAQFCSLAAQNRFRETIAYHYPSDAIRAQQSTYRIEAPESFKQCGRRLQK